MIAFVVLPGAKDLMLMTSCPRRRITCLEPSAPFRAPAGARRWAAWVGSTAIRATQTGSTSGMSKRKQSGRRGYRSSLAGRIRLLGNDERDAPIALTTLGIV